MFNIIKFIDKTSVEFLSRIKSVIGLRVKKRKVRTVIRQELFRQRIVNAWNGLPRKVVAAETEDKFKLELDRSLEVMEIEGYRDVGRT